MAIDPDLLPIHEEFDRRIGMTESQVTSGLVDGYIDASAGITTPATNPPAGVEARIVVRRSTGVTTVRRELPNG